MYVDFIYIKNQTERNATDRQSRYTRLINQFGLPLFSYCRDMCTMLVFTITQNNISIQSVSTDYAFS